jgi:hypothetical protein
MRGIGIASCLLLAGCAQVWGFDETSKSCGPDEMSCDGVCVNTLSDNANCGTCGNACAASQVCGNGTCAASCPIDQMECGGVCADLQSDAAHCGACGMACSNGDICVFGGCEPPCDPAQLSSAITDPWGVAWDAVERTPAPLDVAQVTCRAFGGRLPTATELFRVAANQSGAVGMSFNTNHLWSQSANDNLNQATIRLSDGASGSAGASTATPYRCVCGAPRAKTFTGNRCNGTPGNACFEWNGYHIDTQNRPSLKKSAAVAECLAERAHLVESWELAEAIRAGLPGPNVFVMTADQAIYFGTVQMRWNGVEAAWEPSGNLQVVDNRNASPFRCAATKLAQTPNATEVTNAFLPAISKYKGETMDTPATTLVAAYDACFARGGHLPRATEQAELIAQSLPNGSGAYLWTSDQTGYNDTNFLMAIQRWLAQDPRHSYIYDGSGTQTVTWNYKTTSQAFRCVYYPVDPAYVAPTTCEGGCFELALPGSGGAKMWFDTQDRAAARLGAAFGTCQAAGGHMASERDLAEAIRQGLPNGTGAMGDPWIWASDVTQYPTDGRIFVTIVQWTDVETTTFDDLYPNSMTWAAPIDTRRFRCMWTNELR